MLSPFINRIGSVFVPVQDIEKARDWYCRILNLPVDEAPIHFGHLCPLPMDAPGLILDTMPMWGGKEPGGPPSFQTPAFMLLTDDIEAAYGYMHDQGAERVTEIMDGSWFAFRDPDGNLLMACKR
ncbi:MAG: hypothetical protein K0Q94_5105 [Paenibacillus sp.]|nr:hypothetical protein [Paenibacillus sp.]